VLEERGDVEHLDARVPHLLRTFLLALCALPMQGQTANTGEIVFPIEMPPLRERREDIPLLVEYFIDRFARQAGNSFQAVNKKSLDLLQTYPWPGNIRELQNVIERSVIVCETEKFSVDESWLSRQPRTTVRAVRRGCQAGYAPIYPGVEDQVDEDCGSPVGTTHPRPGFW
jgi:transcriptional regulator with GAF, ATPase, and Fis domain